MHRDPESRRNRRIGPGDGHPLPRYRWWQPFSRALLHIPLTEDDGRASTWSVDVRLGGDSDDGEVRARLYRDGVHQAVSLLPAVFPVPGGVIQVAASAFGLRRAHFVGYDGREHQLAPDPGSAEGWREQLDRTRPGLSRLIGGVSMLVLLVALVLGTPQIAQEITQFPPVAERFGSFVSPIHLPAGWNIALSVAAVVASTERGLRLRYHWLLDGGVFDGEE
ncbi:hypothetical protein FHE66_02785 [Georgenia sp. 311]|uniref:hypothetical protein n=1 Tax=Georgenia sp. 311 TaxID=2585134 RepID=UPI001111BFCA|nr:hypothetical protein [Georgenia sp. 311]TNC19786.1 hypothetical protein FHE66_02785 [Georgenia sp. 311]